jgi:hypothetical protein
MDSHPNTFDRITRPAPTDLSDSLDNRFLVTGRLSPTAIPIRRVRAELAAVLDLARQPRPAAPSNDNSRRNAR